MDKVSVIMPAYNCEKTVIRAIDSVLQQSYKNIELIVIDDGSTDNTKKICKKIKSEKLLFYSKENGGPSSARNYALKKATGKYIMFIDSDDYFLDNTVETMVSLIKMNNCDIVAGNYISFDDDKIYKEKKYNQYNVDSKNDVQKYIDLLIKKNLFNTNWNKIYKAEIIKSNNLLFDESKEIGEDVRFNFDYMKYVKKCYLTNYAIYGYNISSNGLTSKNESTKIIRYLNLIEYQQNYYKEANFNDTCLQKRIFKILFFINDFNDEKINMQYIKILENVTSKKIYLKLLYYLLKNKKYKLLSLIKRIKK